MQIATVGMTVEVSALRKVFIHCACPSHICIHNMTFFGYLVFKQFHIQRTLCIYIHVLRCKNGVSLNNSHFTEGAGMLLVE